MQISSCSTPAFHFPNPLSTCQHRNDIRTSLSKQHKNSPHHPHQPSHPSISRNDICIQGYHTTKRLSPSLHHHTQRPRKTSLLPPLPLKHPPIILRTSNLLLQTTLQRSSDLFFHGGDIPLCVCLAVEVYEFVFLFYSHPQVSVVSTHPTS